MKGAAFNTEGLPYSIDRVTTVFGGGSAAKIANIGEPTFGRTGVVYKNGMEFVFFLGDIMLGEENVLFVERSDTLPVAGTSDLNDAMTTSPFQLNSNGELYFSVFYYVINTELADSVLTENDLVTFGVELVKADNNQVVGTFDNVVYGLNNLNEYDNIDYQVDYSGIESGNYFFRLVTEVEGDSELYLSNVQNDSELLAKKNYRTVKFDELLVPEEYALMQNYPNPFNPSTTIKYQLPKSGIVTLKVYDILGREVTTLVDGFKTEGRYEVNFNASSLASGVYFYRLMVNDFITVKKMLMIK